jgi:hypothetical protein
VIEDSFVPLHSLCFHPVKLVLNQLH